MAPDTSERTNPKLAQGTSISKLAAHSMHPASFPLMEQPGIASLLALGSGLLNAWTFAHAQTFATKKDPNGNSNLYNAGRYFFIVIGFAAGGAIGFGLDILWNGLSIVGAIIITAGMLTASIMDRKDPDAL